MNDIKQMSNDEILSYLVSLQQEHESLKKDILVMLDKLDKIEKLFNEANKIRLERTKRIHE